MSERKRKLFEEDSVFKVVLKLALPTIISQIILVIYNMADTFFIVVAKKANMLAHSIVRGMVQGVPPLETPRGRRCGALFIQARGFSRSSVQNSCFMDIRSFMPSREMIPSKSKELENATFFFSQSSRANLNSP